MSGKLSVQKRLLVALVSLFLCGCAYALMQSSQSPPYPSRELRCIGYLEDGTLYGGQPECAQPPVLYMVGAVLSSFGSSSLQPMAAILLVIINAICLCLIMDLVRPLRAATALAVGFVYCLLVMPLLMGQLDAGLAACFMMAGVWAYFRHRTLGGLAASSVLFGLALSSKVTSLAGIAALSCVFLADVIRADACLSTGVMRRMACFFAPMGSLALLLSIVFPNVLAYAVLSHAHTEQLGYLGAVRSIIGTNPLGDGNLILFYFLVCLGVYSFYTSKDAFALAYVVATLTTFISRYKPVGESPYLFGRHYMVFPIFFLVVLAGRHLSKMPDSKRAMRLAVLFIGAALFFGEFHLQGSPTIKEYIASGTGGYREASVEAEKLSRAIEGVYSLLPANRGDILVDQYMYDLLLRTNVSMNMSRVFNRSSPEGSSRYLDTAFVPGLVYYNVSEGRHFPKTHDEADLAGEIEAGRYEMIFIGPDDWDSLIGSALDNEAAGSARRLGYCMVELPVAPQGRRSQMRMRDYSMLIFHDFGRCIGLVEGSKNYLQSIYDFVCGKDEWVANYIRLDFDSNDYYTVSKAGERGPILLEKAECRSAANLMSNVYSRQRAEDIKAPALVVFIVSWALIEAAGRRQGKGHVGPIKERAYLSAPREID